MTSKIYIGNLPQSYTEDQISQLFSNYHVVHTKLIRDINTGKSRGFAFIELESADDAKLAIDEMNDKEIEESKLVVNYAREREKSHGGGGGYKGGGGGGRGGYGGGGGSKFSGNRGNSNFKRRDSY